MEAFLSGLVQGGSTTAASRLAKGQKGVLSKLGKKAAPAPTGNTRDVNTGVISSFKRGGKVKHTGLAKVHKGERVLTKKQQGKMKGRGRGGKRR